MDYKFFVKNHQTNDIKYQALYIYIWFVKATTKFEMPSAANFVAWYGLVQWLLDS